MKLGTTVPIYAPVKPIELPEESATLVNITDASFRGERTYGVYTICGVGRCKCDPTDPNRCIPGDGYVMKVIHPRRGMIDMGDNNWTARKPGQKEPDLKNVQQFVVHAEDIASDLVREWRSDLTGIGGTVTGEVGNESVNGFTGVFLADGAEPTDEELAQARQLLAQCDQALVAEAHRDWDQFHEPKSIHDSYKRAARRLGVDAAWLYTVTDKNALPDCPHCGSKLKTASATVCATCHRDVVPANAQEREPVGAKAKGKSKPKQGSAVAA
jgi:hypothetical protein